MHNQENNPESKNYDLSIKNIINPGAFLFQGRIYLVGGLFIHNDSCIASDKIFSFSVYNENFEIREESVKLPFPINNPVCTSGTSHAFIAGGKLKDDSPNFQMFVIKFENNEVKIFESKLDSPIEENYPPTYLENNVILFSFPKLWIKPKNSDKLHGFTFSRKASSLQTSRSATIIVKRPLEVKPALVKNTNLGISLINNSDDLGPDIINQSFNIKKSKKTEKKVTDRTFNEEEKQ